MKKIYLFILLSFLYSNINAQTTFEKQYTLNAGSSKMCDMIKTLDNKYMVSGADGVNGKWYLMKIDTLGNIISKWKYEYGSDNSGDQCYVRQCPDSGYVVYGRGDLTSFGVARIMKVDKNGSLIWEKEFNAIHIKSVIVLNNNQILVGSPAGVGFGLIKLDANGNVLWSKTNNAGANETVKVILTLDNKIAIVGQVRSGSFDYTQVTKLDTLGNTVWSRLINAGAGSWSVVPKSLCQLTDSSYIAVVAGNGYHYGVKLDKNGTYVSNFEPGTNSSMKAISDVVALPSNEFLYVGYYNSAEYLRLYKYNSGITSESAWRISQLIPSFLVSPACIVKSNDNNTLLPGPILCGITYNSASQSSFRYEIVRLKWNLSGCSSVSLGSDVITSTTFIGNTIGQALTNSTPTLTTNAIITTIPSSSVSQICFLAPLSVSSTQTNVLCNGSCTGSVTAIPAGGQAPYSYSWTGGGTGATKTGMCAGTYTCTVTDALSSISTLVVSITQPTIITVSANATTPSLCSGNCTNLNATSSGGMGSYTYVWMPGSLTGSTVNVCPTSTTTYTCTTTDANACTKTSTVIVTVTNIPATPGTISGPATICSGTTNTYSITAIAGATSYTWTLPSGWSGTSTTNSINATASSTSGNITVTSNNTCGNSSPQTLAITVNTIPSTPGTISGTTTICSGTTNTYSITAVAGATSYTWTLPGGWTGTSTTNSINATASATSGNITVTANNTCGNSSAQTLAVVVNTIPVTPGTISGLASMCIGTGAQTYSITAVGGAASYTWTLPATWSGTSTTNSIVATTGTSGGNITVTANNTCGNSSPQTLAVIINPLPVVTYSQSPALACINATSVALGTVSPTGGTFTGTAVTGSTFNASTAGTGTFNITYTYTDGNGCVNSAISSIVVDPCTGVSQNSIDNDILIYPNPTTSIVTLSGIEKESTIEVFNVVGEKVIFIQSQNTSIELDLSELEKGIYVIKIISKKTNVTRRIVKE